MGRTSPKRFEQTFCLTWYSALLCSAAVSYIRVTGRNCSARTTLLAASSPLAKSRSGIPQDELIPRMSRSCVIEQTNCKEEGRGSAREIERGGRGSRGASDERRRLLSPSLSLSLYIYFFLKSFELKSERVRGPTNLGGGHETVAYSPGRCVDTHADQSRDKVHLGPAHVPHPFGVDNETSPRAYLPRRSPTGSRTESLMGTCGLVSKVEILN